MRQTCPPVKRRGSKTLPVSPNARLVPARGAGKPHALYAATMAQSIASLTCERPILARPVADGVTPGAKHIHTAHAVHGLFSLRH